MDPGNVELDWLTGIVARPGDDISVSSSRARPKAGFAEAERFAILPNAVRPRLLLPLASPKAAARALASPGYGSGRLDRIGRAAVRAGLRVGVAQRLLRTRLSLSVRTDAAGEPPAELLLTQHLRDVLGRRDVEAAIRVGPTRPNRKPVIQVITHEGEVVAYAKVGWNPLTRSLVETEAGVLRDLEARLLESFAAPRILHFGRWHELAVLVIAPLAARPWSKTGMPLGLLTAALDEIVSLRQETGPRRLSEAAYWTQRRERIASVGAPALADIAERIERRYGSAGLTLGGWHGDWAPRNVGVLGDRLAIWDWERSQGVAPVGLDAAHFDLHVGLGQLGHRSDEAAEYAVARRGPMLGTRDTGDDPRLLVGLAVLEMCLRWEEGRHAGLEGPPPHLRALEKIVP